ncbi:hypothetical protein [Paramagnetospirillum kuznetsovii]|nr:hypothetical protein [Paramagnetospirillum kuznetsovii]
MSSTSVTTASQPSEQEKKALAVKEAIEALRQRRAQIAAYI